MSARELVEDPAQPNIVVLNVDDHGMSGDVVWSRLETINSLFIERGVSFTNYWNNFPLCCPGRATQLTGQMAHHHGVIVNDGRLLDDSVTIATELHDAGYHTFISGKYLNLTNELPDKTPAGWDRAAIFSGGYYRYPAWIDGVVESHGSAEGDYSTDVFADHSMALLDAAPAEKPLFAYLNPFAVHQGADQEGATNGVHPPPAERHRGDARCADLPAYAPANYNEADVTDKPLYIRKQPLSTEPAFPLTSVCEALLSVDEWLGRFVDELQSQGRFDNTVFVLTTDNGAGWGSSRWFKKIAPYSSRSLLYVSWPQVMGNSDAVDTSLLSSIDLAPTLCELGGCDGMGPFANGLPVDGQSFAGLVAPGLFASVPERDSIVLEHLGPKSQVPRWRGLISSPDGPRGQWFLIEYPATGEVGLYRISRQPCLGWSAGMFGDPCMLRNLAHVRKWRSVRTRLHNLLVARW